MLKKNLQIISNNNILITIPCENTSQVKTPWIKKDKPSSVIITENNNDYVFNLEYQVTRAGKKVLIGFGSLEYEHVKIVFSYGVDDSRPSYRGTITFTPKKGVCYE